MEDIIIPRPLQIVVDDLGWFRGTDDREKGGASRTGMCRPHCYKDYIAMNELGKALGQKIFCAFCLSEWDPDNRLKKFVPMSKYGEGWDNARYIDTEEVKRCVDVINESEYIDFALHGMNHGYYCEESGNPDSSDYYIRTREKRMVFTGEEYVRAILDSFFELMRYYGIKKEVTAMVPPSGAYRFNELSKVLADYGIKYINQPFKWVKHEGMEKPEDLYVENGIITTDRYCPDVSGWNVYSIDYDELPPVTHIFGSHWPNWLHEDPDRNMEVIKSAVRYFYRCAELPECIISEDMRFASTQTMFWKYADVTQNDKGETVIDITNVPRLDSMNNSFCINSRFPIIEVEGAKFAEFDRKRDFVTYEITPESNVIVLK